MEQLRDCISVDNTIKEHHAGADDHGDEILEVVSMPNSPTLVFQLDNDTCDWGEGRKPEGIVIGRRRNGDEWVIFMEMKHYTDNASFNAWKAELQLLSGVWHFAPHKACNGCSDGKQRHGDEHHGQWISGQDVLSYKPTSEHKVAAIVMFVGGSGARNPKLKVPRYLRLAGDDVCMLKPVQFRLVMTHLNQHRVAQFQGIDDLCIKAGL